MTDQESEYIDARDGFLDLYRSISDYKKKEKININEYHNLHEAIEFAREALSHLSIMESNGNNYYIHERKSIYKRLDELQDISKHFVVENKVKYKKKKIKIGKYNTEKRAAKKKKKEALNIFYDMVDSFNNRYRRLNTFQKKDMITITEYSDLEEAVEYGKRILKLSFPATTGKPSKKVREDRIDLVSKISKIYRIKKDFWKGCRVSIDSEWTNRDWSQ